eukprot:scpid97432/ scgid14325/ 
MDAVFMDGATFYPPEWSSPAPATEEIKTLCAKYRDGVEKVYNGGNKFQQFTPTYFTSITKKNEYEATRVKVWINPIAQIRLQVHHITPPPTEPLYVSPTVRAYCDGSLEEGPPPLPR